LEIVMRHVFTLALFAFLAAVVAADPPAPAAGAAKAYPLTTCIITGEKLGSMGPEVPKVYDGQEVKFCCKGCIKKFEKDSAGYVKKITEAAASAPKAK
jgi:YHS domain-containing protein